MPSSLLKRPGVLLGGVAIYGVATLGAYLTFYEPKAAAADAPAVTDARRRQVFDANAPQYDRDVGWDETLMGVSLLRRVLLRRARGQVLEVAAGTGRNLAYYPADARLTLTDFSSGMLAEARAKDPGVLAELCVMSASELQFPAQSFDTVVDTFGLCSMDDPARALREMQRVCRRGGRILLLEHGRSSFDWLSGVLDKFADAHAQKWGCHWNRDILQLVDSAGLEVETVRRFHFGTTYYIVARPKADSDHETSESA